MPVQYFDSENLQQLLDQLRHYGELHAPVRGDDGAVRFAPLPVGTLPVLTTLRTMLPVKKYLLHTRETILKYSLDSGYQQPDEAAASIILFGLHPCDLAGINYLDRIFMVEEPDPLYAARRSALTLVGISCSPDEFCSCHRSPSPLHAYADLFLQTVAGGFAVTCGTLKGDVLLKELKDILAECDLAIPEDTRRFFGRKASERALAEIDATLPECQEFADHCLGCGACSLVCPTCACFDVMESSGLDGSSARRVRQWDNCLFKSHSQVAGGIYFNKSRAERFRYRYRHKYRGFGLLHGIPSCVGCGRCRVACPAGLDLRPLAERLEGDAP